MIEILVANQVCDQFLIAYTLMTNISVNMFIANQVDDRFLCFNDH